MECTQARRFFLVRVIRHDVVEINLEACDVLFHGTSGSPRLTTKVCYTLAKTKLISLFEYARRQERGTLIVKEGNGGIGLIVKTD